MMSLCPVILGIKYILIVDTLRQNTITLEPFDFNYVVWSNLCEYEWLYQPKICFFGLYTSFQYGQAPQGCRLSNLGYGHVNGI